MKFQDETVITMMVEVSDSIFRARGCQKLSEIIALDLSIVFCAAHITIWKQPIQFAIAFVQFTFHQFQTTALHFF